jgi:hypothetical protein
VAFSQLAATVADSNLQKLLSSRYGTFDSENGDSDQHSCHLVVKRLFGDVSGIPNSISTLFLGCDAA